jgi:hypothetical protein
MAEAEQPERSDQTVTVDDIKQLTAAATPHFALQIRNRVRNLIADLPSDDPARIEGEREIARLEELALNGETRGPAEEGERPLPSLNLGK